MHNLHLLRTLSSSILLCLMLAGCGEPADNTKPAKKADSAKTTSSAATTPPVATPGKDEQTCFECKGVGTGSCRACVKGKAECPGPCMRLTKGTWVHMNVAGHDPKELWQQFRGSGGKGGQAWNQNHVGEVVVIQNGEPVNIGPCKICGGTTRVTCPTCKGEGRQACPICEGRKVVPLAWTATDNLWFNRQPDIIRIKDGRVLLGKVAATVGSEVILRLRDGKTMRVNQADVLSKP